MSKEGHLGRDQNYTNNSEQGGTNKESAGSAPRLSREQLPHGGGTESPEREEPELVWKALESRVRFYSMVTEDHQGEIRYHTLKEANQLYGSEAARLRALNEMNRLWQEVNEKSIDRDLIIANLYVKFSWANVSAGYRLPKDLSLEQFERFHSLVSPMSNESLVKLRDKLEGRKNTEDKRELEEVLNPPTLNIRA